MMGKIFCFLGWGKHAYPISSCYKGYLDPRTVDIILVVVEFHTCYCLGNETFIVFTWKLLHASVLLWMLNSIFECWTLMISWVSNFNHPLSWAFLCHQEPQLNSSFHSDKRRTSKQRRYSSVLCARLIICVFMPCVETWHSCTCK